MAVTLKYSKVLNLVLVAFCFLFVASLQAHEKLEIRLKSTVETHKKNLCLADLLLSHNLNPRDAQKIEKYCRIEFNGKTLRLSAKDIELYAWAAGILPDKILGGGVTIQRANSLQLPQIRTQGESEKQQSVRRGSKVQLVLKSANMRIAREGSLLRDTFLGEDTDVRPQGTRKTLRAKLLSPDMAELQP